MLGLGIHDDLGEGYLLLGRRVPDLDLATSGGPLRVFALLHDVRPVLLDLGEPGGLDISPWAQRVLAVDARYADNRELPAQVATPAAVLIKPDGCATWWGTARVPGCATR